MDEATAQKLQQVLTTKTNIKAALENIGLTIDAGTPFSSYPEIISAMNTIFLKTTDAERFVTTITMNGTDHIASQSKIDLGTVLTAHQSLAAYVKTIKINGSSKTPTNGTIDLGTVLTAHQSLAGYATQTWVGNNYSSKTHTHSYAGSSSAGGAANSLKNFVVNKNSGQNANDCLTAGHTYYTSNGPAKSLGATTDDGALYVQANSNNWVAQIAQDYRNGRLFVRGKNNGTWSAWKRIANYDEVLPLSGGTLLGGLTIKGQRQWFRYQSDKFTKGNKPGATTYNELIFKDGSTETGNEQNVGIFGTSVNTDGVITTFMRSYTNKVEDKSNWIGLCGDMNGKIWTYAPTPASKVNDAQIATTAYVNSYYLPLSGGTLTGKLTLGYNLNSNSNPGINARNCNIVNVNNLQFQDTGPNEGLEWGGALWRIYVSDDDLTNNSNSSSLQFVKDSTRKMTLDANGNLYVTGNVFVPDVTL